MHCKLLWIKASVKKTKQKNKQENPAKPPKYKFVCLIFAMLKHNSILESNKLTV